MGPQGTRVAWPDRSWVISKLRVEEGWPGGGQGIPYLHPRGVVGGQLLQALGGPQYPLWEKQRWSPGAPQRPAGLRLRWAAPLLVSAVSVLRPSLGDFGAQLT